MKNVKTDQVFIHVDVTYTAKNQLHKIAIEKAYQFQNLLCRNMKTAKQLIRDKMKEAADECKTRCAPLNIDFWDGRYGTSAQACNISGIIRLSIHPVYVLEHMTALEKMDWIKLDKENLPEGEVLAANFKSGTYGYQEKNIGYLHWDKSNDVISCESEEVLLENCSHYIDLNKHDIV